MKAMNITLLKFKIFHNPVNKETYPVDRNFTDAIKAQIHDNHRIIEIVFRNIYIFFIEKKNLKRANTEFLAVLKKNNYF